MIAFTAIGAAALIVATAGTLLVQAVRSRHQRRFEQARLKWADRWIDVVFSGVAPPRAPLDQAAADALLDLRESLSGEPAEAVARLIHDYRIDVRLIERLRRVRWSHLAERIDVLDGLGRARSRAAVPTLMIAAADPQRSARLMGIRALARSVAALDTDDEREAVAAGVTRVLRNANLSAIALGEAMELLGPAAVHVVAEILAAPQHWGDDLVTTALNAIGRFRLATYTDDVVHFASSRRTGVRVAALHALTRLERLPASAAPIVDRAFRDDNEAVRIEAARASHLLEKRAAIANLEDLLTDEEWTVRRVAATTLAGLGGPGVRTLIATSLVHGDPRARSVATQVLVESRSASELHQATEKVG